MTDKDNSIINIALVGGGPFCKKVIEKIALGYPKKAVNASIVAVADPDFKSPGVIFAKEKGLQTVRDYHELYQPEYDIHLIIILTPDKTIFEDILKTKPHNIRILAYHVFELFWKAIGLERERAEEIETILNGIQDFILVITPEREIIDVNQPFLDQMGYSREEVIGSKCHEIYHKEDHPCNGSDLFCPLNRVIRDKRPSQQVRTRVDHNGERRYIEVTIYPIWEKDGKISKFIEISRDITERKKEESEITQRLEQMVEERTRQLKETHGKLLHQDKMASLGKLSASVVHEINNPIAGILNLIILIKRIIEEGPMSQKELDLFSRYLNLMETETRRTSRIVSNLLAFSRQSKVDLKSLNVNRLLEKILFLNSNLLKMSGVEVEKKLDANLPDIVGSEDQLQQVFMNLVSNAGEAIEVDGGGILSIESECFSEGDKITVSFRDTGAGIREENLSRLFEPFFTTKKKGKGVGLGLSVAYGIIEEHGGSINVESEEGKGTTFKVELPLRHISERLDPDGGPYVEH
ncbi:MAG: PAS domain-containing protein [Desulfobacterales bacterium]|nr:PAS domain-containing protein [Desulfobacterales bacterium]